MSETVLDLDDTDLDGSNETASFLRGEDPANTTLRLINTLDTNVDMTVAGTHGEDDALDDTQDLETVSATDGSTTKQFAGSRITEEWERVEVTLAFGADPTAGSVKVVQMGGEA